MHTNYEIKKYILCTYIMQFLRVQYMQIPVYLKIIRNFNFVNINFSGLNFYYGLVIYFLIKMFKVCKSIVLEQLSCPTTYCSDSFLLKNNLSSLKINNLLLLRLGMLTNFLIR